MMKILDVSQSNDTEAWLAARRGKITGTKSGKLAPEHYRGSDRLKINIDFWKYLAEIVAMEPDGEPPMERGHRLENTNAEITLKKVGISLDSAQFDTGLWVSDADDRIAISPDVCEKGDAPTWAVECKSLGSAYHLQAVITYRVWQILQNNPSVELKQFAALYLSPIALDPDALPIDFVPEQYRSQALQYFIVNPDLQTLYFSFYDDRVYGDLAHDYIPIPRDKISPDRDTLAARIARQADGEKATLAAIDTITKIMGLTF